jgi:hypothetical protein
LQAAGLAASMVPAGVESKTASMLFSNGAKLLFALVSASNSFVVGDIAGNGQCFEKKFDGT